MSCQAPARPGGCPVRYTGSSTPCLPSPAHTSSKASSPSALDAPYEPGRRDGAWLKHKHRCRETFVVTGWRPAAARARRPDSIFIARTRPDGTLIPAGSAELGISADKRDRLRSALAERHLETRRGSHRVAGGNLVDVDYHGDRRDAARRSHACAAGGRLSTTSPTLDAQLGPVSASQRERHAQSLRRRLSRLD